MGAGKISLGVTLVAQEREMRQVNYSSPHSKQKRERDSKPIYYNEDAALEEVVV